MQEGYEILFKIDIAALDDCFTKAHQEAFSQLEESIISADNFKFYPSVSAVYSSKSEGEEIERDAFIKHKKFGGHFLPNHTQKIDDLYSAYLFAEDAALNEQNLYHAHAIIISHILQKRKGASKGKQYVRADRRWQNRIRCGHTCRSAA